MLLKRADTDKNKKSGDIHRQKKSLPSVFFHADTDKINKQKRNNRNHAQRNERILQKFQITSPLLRNHPLYHPAHPAVQWNRQAGTLCHFYNTAINPANFRCPCGQNVSEHG
jgi:hypothetical protein